jgi:hypothetical protein
MSKRKRASKPAADDSTDDAAAKDDMVHVSPDLLAGSPEIFAGKKADEPEPEQVESEPAAQAEVQEVDSEPIEPEPPAASPAETPSEPADASATMTSEPVPPMGTEPAADTTLTPPPLVQATPYAPRPRRGGSSAAALGMVLIVVGAFALVVVLSGVDLTQYGWPLFVIIPGLTLLIVGFTSFGSAATIPGGVVTVLGLLLAYQNSTGDWPTWAFAWALVVPGGVGLGMYLQALRDRDQHALRTGRTLMFIGLMIAVIGFVLFESILGISGRDYGIVGKGALPALLIVIGLILLVRSVQRARQA